VTYAPQPDGSFAAPGPGLLRSYLDGDYTIRVGGYLSNGTAQVEYLTAFFGLNGTTGVTRSGNHLDNLMSGGTGADVFSGAGGKDWLFGGFGGDRRERRHAARRQWLRPPRRR
jgi:Ca2+-binding RTX toxin-like protein